jgi:putative membrane protein
VSGQSRRRAAYAAASMVILTFASCKPRSSETASRASDTSTGAMAMESTSTMAQDTGAAPQTPTQLDDPTALATYEALVTYDIQTAGIAAKKSAKSDIRDLASGFVQGHKGLLKQAEDLAKKLNMTPTPPKEAPLGQAHADALRKLNATKGEEFDRVFLANEVAYHDGAIKILNELLPAIKNPELKAAVTAAVPAFQAHLTASQKAAAKYHVV